MWQFSTPRFLWPMFPPQDPPQIRQHLHLALLPQPLSPPSLPSLSTVLQSHIPTLQHVPKGARDLWAKTFSSCLSAVASSIDDIDHWLRLFMLAKCVLASPAAGHRLRWREILQHVKERLRRWSDGEWLSLWSEALADGQSLASRRDKSTSAPPTHNIRRAKHAVQNGQYSMAITALSSEGLANPSTEVLQEMLSKHPQARPPFPMTRYQTQFLSLIILSSRE